MKDVTKMHMAAVLEAPAGLPSRHPQLPFREAMGMGGTWLTSTKSLWVATLHNLKPSLTGSFTS